MISNMFHDGGKRSGGIDNTQTQHAQNYIDIMPVGNLLTLQRDKSDLLQFLYFVSKYFIK